MHPIRPNNQIPLHSLPTLKHQLRPPTSTLIEIYILHPTLQLDLHTHLLRLLLQRIMQIDSMDQLPRIRKHLWHETQIIAEDQVVGGR